MPVKIVVLDGATLNPGDTPWTPIQLHGELTVYPSTPPESIVDRCAGAEIVVTNKVPLDAQTLAQLADLKLIAVTATGYNVVDISAAEKLGITVCNVPVYSTQAVAQHVFAMVLEFTHRVSQHNDAIAEGQWQRRSQFSFWLSPITELSGKTMGIVGFGRIGQATAKLAQAFGMNIAVSSRTRKNVPGFESAQWGSINDVFATSDYVTLHCPLTAENNAFVDRSLIEKMKPNALLINTARGGLINESDLADALNAHQIGGACLDVLSTEPPASSNPLLSADRCLLTPHIAWTAIEARQRLMKITADNIEAYLAGHPKNVINS